MLRIIFLVSGFFYLGFIGYSSQDSVITGSSLASVDQNISIYKARSKARARGNRITKIVGYDEGSFGSDATESLQLDVIQDVCNPDDGTGNPELEPFYDTVVGLTVKNESAFIVRLKSFSYVVRDAFGDGRNFRSKRKAVAGVAELDPYGSGLALGFLLDVVDGGKTFVGSDRALSQYAGIKNVLFRLNGINALGQKVRVTAESAFSFDNFRRCSN